MVFSMGNKTLPDIIDEIANGLIITTGGYWTDADTTWNTTTRTGDSTRRALKYNNLTTGEILYIALESINLTKSVYSAYYYDGGCGGWATRYRKRKGLRVTFSSTWDGAVHTYGTTRQQSFVMFEGKWDCAYPQFSDVRADLAVLPVTYYLWIESNGFALMGRPAPASEDDQQSSFIVVVERNPNKEYTDTYSNFYCYNRINAEEWNWPRNDAAGNGLRLESVLRPFAYVSCARKDYNQDPNSWYGDVYQYLQRSWDTTYLGFPYDPRGIQFPILSYKGITDGKIRFTRPVIHNSITWQGNKHSMEFDPIFISELFFPFREDGGIVDGDIIRVDGIGITKKYLCKSLDSADYATRLNYAIKYSD